MKAEEYKKLWQLQEHIDKNTDCYCEYNEDCFTIFFTRPAEDYFDEFGLDYFDTVDELVEEIIKYCNNFDVDEHVDMWVEARNKGINEVPSTTILVDDARTIADGYNDLFCAVYGWRHHEFNYSYA